MGSRCAHGAAGMAIALLWLAQLGGGAGNAAQTNQINRSSRAPLGTPAPAPVVRPDSLWAPDRYVATPDASGTIHIPGHWERILPSGELYAPPLTACNTATGECATMPAGPLPPPETRPAPRIVPRQAP